MLDTNVAFAVSVIILLIFMALGVGIAWALGLSGFIGFILTGGFDKALSFISIQPYTSVSVYALTVVPLFIIMGSFAAEAGIISDVFATMNKWVGRLPGGLAVSTVFACALFAACTGSSVASAAMMGRVAIPEMRKFQYDPKFACGCVACAGTLAILIPPSSLFVIYCYITGESLGQMLIAGVIPGIMSALVLAFGIILRVKFNPKIAPLVPSEQAPSWKERLVSLRSIWGIAFLFFVVIGGIYLGVFTATEAGAVGALAAFLLAFGIHKFKKNRAYFNALMDTVRTCGMVFAIIIGASIFGLFTTYCGMGVKFTELVTALPFSPIVTLIFILILYLPLGMFLDPNSILLMTMPIVYPAVIGLGFNGIWFGILITILIELSLLTPPVGLNVFVVKGVVKDVPLYDIFSGVYFFCILMGIILIILVAFPQISLFLPEHIFALR